jgi:hypothetical protein
MSPTSGVKMSSPRRYSISIAATHWVPFNERILAYTKADTLICAEWIFDAYVKSVPHDGVNYEIELAEWDYESNKEISRKLVEITNPTASDSETANQVS